jgi:hypothetical protein
VIEDLKEIRSQMLAILVRDFGYTRAPTYGWAPLRHQFAWKMATKDMSESEVEQEVKRNIRGQRLDGFRMITPEELSALWDAAKASSASQDNARP